MGRIYESEGGTGTKATITPATTTTPTSRASAASRFQPGLSIPPVAPCGTGPIEWQRDYIVNVIGMKRWVFGKHDVMTSAAVHAAAGEQWGLQPSTQVAHPESGQTINTFTFREQRGTNQLEDFWTLNLNATYQFPISGGVQGIIGGEAANVTNEQSLIRINIRNGRPRTGLDTFQFTREYRLKLGIRF